MDAEKVGETRIGLRIVIANRVHSLVEKQDRMDDFRPKRFGRRLGLITAKMEQMR